MKLTKTWSKVSAANLLSRRRNRRIRREKEYRRRNKEKKNDKKKNKRKMEKNELYKLIMSSWSFIS